MCARARVVYTPVVPKMDDIESLESLELSGGGGRQKNLDNIFIIHIYY